MTDYLTLTEFVPGTKAKAQEVNTNFSLLKDAVNQKASMEGDSTQNFAVAAATQDEHAVNKSQLNSLLETLTAEIKKTESKFCVKSGYTTSGCGDLLSYSVLTITPKIGGTYGNLTISDYRGIQTKISSANTISMSGKVDGDYNIFITAAGNIYTLKNTIYVQPNRPTMVDGDIWLNTSTNTFNCTKYDGTNDIEFLDVPIGKVTMSSSSIISLKTLAFNQNGHNVTTQTSLKSGTNLASSISNFAMPNYTNGVSKSFSTVYQAESDGYVYVKVRYAGTFYTSPDNAIWTSFVVGSFSDQGYYTGGMFPVSKNLYYKAITSETSTSLLKFHPCLSA